MGRRSTKGCVCNQWIGDIIWGGFAICPVHDKEEYERNKTTLEIYNNPAVIDLRGKAITTKDIEAAALEIKIAVEKNWMDLYNIKPEDLVIKQTSNE